MTKRPELATEVMRTDAGFHADQTRWHVGKACFNLATRPLLTQHDRTAAIEADDVETSSCQYRYRLRRLRR